MKNTRHLLSRFIPYFKNYKLILCLDLFCAMLTTACDIVLPLIVRYITDTALEDIGNLTVSAVLIAGALYIALRVVDVFAHYYMQNAGHVMGAKIEADMRRDLFAKFQKLSYSFYSDAKVGQLMSRITSDLFDITEFSHHCPEEFFIAGVKIIASFIILCSMNIPLTLIIFAIFPFMFVFTKHFRGKMRDTFKRNRVELGEINSQVEDSLLGIRVVKSFANEAIEEKKFEKGNARFLETKKESYRYMAGFHSSTRFFDGLMYIVVVIAGAFFMMDGKITPGELVAYLLYVTTLLTSIRRIVEFTEQFQRGMTGIERFVEIIDEPVDIEDSEGATVLPAVSGEITFDNVSFRYTEDTKFVLSELDLCIRPGENVALVGPSGAGKTTICNLISRFYDVTSGVLSVDGYDVRTVTTESLRNQIGIVQQDVYLFSGTVYENIEYGLPGASKEEIENAARLAGAHEFICELPDGYNTFVGERGIKLSGGQKQRISIARVFLKNPPILILDEATSALDNESERLVQESLKLLAKGRTTLTIAHRLTTIKNADIILVLTDDGIVERGSHTELMQKGGMYSELYKLYSAE